MNDKKRAELERYLERSAGLSTALVEPEDHLSRGNAYYALGEHEHALEEFELALTARPGYVNALFNKGVVLITMGAFQEAEEAFAKTISLAKSQNVALQGEAYHYLARALYAQGRYADALRAIKQATAATADPDSMYLRAQLHALLSQPSGASEWLRKAIAVQPRFRDTARGDPAFNDVRSSPEIRDLLLDKSA